MTVTVRCQNPACGQATRLCDDGLNRVFRCPGCRTRLPFAVSSLHARSAGALEEEVIPGTVDGSGIWLRFEDFTATADETAIPEGTETEDLEHAFRVGRLELRDKLGSGTFATTYHAFDPLLERDVTLKVYHTSGEDCSKDPDHFLTEAKALARMQHPLIAPIYDAGHEGAYHYIAMAFIEGQTLAEAIVDKPIDPRNSARIVSEVAEALAYAHGLGIVHRDIKPSNIVLDACGVAHVIDFGLAHRPGLTKTVIRSGTIRGTPAYLAPEQATGHDAAPIPRMINTAWESSCTSSCVGGRRSSVLRCKSWSPRSSKNRPGRGS